MSCLTQTFTGCKFETRGRNGHAQPPHTRPTLALHVLPSVRPHNTAPPMPPHPTPDHWSGRHTTLCILSAPRHRPLPPHTTTCLAAPSHSTTAPYPFAPPNPCPLSPWPRAPLLRLNPRAPPHAPPCPHTPHSSDATPAGHVPLPLSPRLCC